MFGALTFDVREPLGWQDLARGLVVFVQDAGGFAALGIALWLVFGYASMRPEERERIPRWERLLVLIGILGGFVAYLPVLGLNGYAFFAWFFNFFRASADPSKTALQWKPWMLKLEGIGLFAGGAFALFTVCTPFLRNLAAVRLRRVWALTRLSFREAIRRRALYAFSGLLLVFLFAGWFISPKREDQVRTYVGVVFYAMTLLLVGASILLAAFSIPDDVRRQTIHTIVTKPVERFEIFLGRFLGLFGLMSLVLIAVTAFSLLYVVRGVNPEAAAESLKARVPVYGDQLTFLNTRNENEADNVGREWGYRKYINAKKSDQKAEQAQTAVWSFPTLPSALASRSTVQCEYTFDIYRTNKGTENQGVACSFLFKTRNYRRDSEKSDRYKNDLKELSKNPELARASSGVPSQLKAADVLAEKYGFYEVPSTAIKDYHTLTMQLPGGLFRNALKDQEGSGPIALRVEVRCLSPGQLVGVAKHDLYLREDNPNSGAERARFALNFFKGAFGLWLVLGLFIGIAVALSTYLSGVISLLVVGLLYLAGVCLPFMQLVAEGRNPEGGPVTSLIRLSKNQGGVLPLEEGTAKHIAEQADAAFRWFINRIKDVVPDVDRFDLKDYVAEGFDISMAQLCLTTLLLLAYLLPWVVLGHYLLRWREVAAAT